MSQLSVNQSLTEAFDQWLTAEILKLSVDTLRLGVLTCTACSESTTGEYVIDYKGETFRHSPEKTYAFLRFVTANSDKQAE